MSLREYAIECWLYSVLLLTTHAVAAVWLLNLVIIGVKLWTAFGSQPRKWRKMGVLHCSSWTEL